LPSAAQTLLKLTPDDHLEGAGLGNLDLLELEGVGRLALPLLADHPGRHRLRQRSGLYV
jgi:hypothetical protein